jgi:hypothetical protein
MSCEDYMIWTVQNNDVTRRCGNVNLSKLVQNVFSVGGCEILVCI